MLKERNYEFKVSCVSCKKTYTLKVNIEDYFLFDSPNRPHIQDIFPYLTPAERELLLSGMCEECWNKMFTIEDEDLEEEDYE